MLRYPTDFLILFRAESAGSGYPLCVGEYQHSQPVLLWIKGCLESAMPFSMTAAPLV